MRILIVGGGGEVGRYVTKHLIRQGHPVTVFDRAQRPAEFGAQSAVTYVRGDLNDQALVREVVPGKDVILHLAWSFADDASTIFGEDIKGRINLMEAASSSKVSRFIYTSTATVYGRAVVHPVTETHPCLIQEARKPLYALGKYTAEELCLFYSKERGIPVMIFRFWWAFGDAIGGRHLRDLIKKALSHQPLEMVRGAGGAFLTMADLAQAVVLAMGKPAATGQTYNLGSLFMKWEEIGQMIVQLTKSNSPVQFVPSSEWRGPAFLNEVWDLSWEKAEKELGYRTTESPEGMRSQFMKALQGCVNQVKGRN